MVYEPYIKLFADHTLQTRGEEIWIEQFISAHPNLRIKANIVFKCSFVIHKYQL